MTLHFDKNNLTDQRAKLALLEAYADDISDNAQAVYAEADDRENKRAQLRRDTRRKIERYWTSARGWKSGGGN